MPSSRTISAHAIAGCLKAAERFVGPNRTWHGTTPDHTELLGMMPQLLEDLPLLEDVMATAASRSNVELMAFLAQRGHQIQIPAFQGQEFGTACVLDSLVKWHQAGKKVRIQACNSKAYSGVEINNIGARFYTSRRCTDPVVELTTQNNDRVFLTNAGDCSLSDLALIRVAKAISSDLGPGHGYDKIHFPMVDLAQILDLPWLLGLFTTDPTGLPAIVAFAQASNKLRMNETGARAESAVAMGFARSMRLVEPKTLVIDRPFFVWFLRPGCLLPYFVGYIDYADWKNPGTLGR